ncbi:hypothetical protein [Saccharopolyspora taberi]|uniref:hypothetical protein n=1 Tax=Saccharopolyspora taberi TaxID=60895 RepID=UPI0031D3BC3B
MVRVASSCLREPSSSCRGRIGAGGFGELAVDFGDALVGVALGGFAFGHGLIAVLSGLSGQLLRGLADGTGAGKYVARVAD